MGSNNPYNYKEANTSRYDIELTAAEAARGCTRNVLIDGQMYTLNIPAGACAGDVFEVRSGNEYLIGTVAISIKGSAPAPSGGSVSDGPKKTVKPWVFLAAGVVIAAIVAAIAFGGGSGGGASSPGESCAGITFDLPSGWSEDKSWHEDRLDIGDESWYFRPSDNTDSEACIFIDSYNNNSNPIYFEKYFKDGIEAFGEDQYSWMDDDDDYQILNRGPVTIDGTECWLVEYDNHGEVDDNEWDSRIYEVFIPVSKYQMTGFEFVISKGETDSETGSYVENELFDSDMKLREKVLSSIRITDTGDYEVSLPDYKEKEYTFNGLKITMPSDFEKSDNSSSDNISWHRPDWSDMYLGFFLWNDRMDPDSEAKRSIDEDYERYSGDPNYDDYENVNKGTIEIDGVTSYYVEYVRAGDEYRTYYYEMLIPLQDRQQIIFVSMNFDDNGILNETDRLLKERILNSIRID